MKKLVFILVTLICLCSCGEKPLPLPENESGIRGDLGIDKNINEETIDNYLNRKDSVYRDMRMLIDEADYEAIGGDSYLSGFVKGFEVVPYPYLCNVEGLPIEVGETYSGDTLFSYKVGEYVANYEESMNILENLFPKDKCIFLMCGGGGYAGMTKKMLVSLGWDENKIYNVGGYWYYNGKNNVEVKYIENNQIHYDFSKVNYHEIDFSSLTSLGIDNTFDEKESLESKIDNSKFIKLGSIEELNKLENNSETFPLFVYLSGCPTCANFYPLVERYSIDNAITMYAIDLHSIWETSNSVTERIKFAPSLFIYKDGEVLAYLNPSSDDDYNYYKDYDELTKWIASFISTSEFTCEACVIK